MDLWNIGGALLGGLFGGDDQEQTSTSKSEPWSYAQPWMRENIESGQRLQSHYQQNPFSEQQQRSYGNSFGLSDRVRAMAPSLTRQLSNRPAFDRSNPLLRPVPFNFETAPGTAPGGSPGGSSSPFGPNPFSGQWRPPAPSAGPVGPAPGVGMGVGDGRGDDFTGGLGGLGGRGFAFDPMSYTFGLVPALTRSGQMAPVVDQWGGSVGSDGGYGGFGGQTGGDGAVGFGGVY